MAKKRKEISRSQKDIAEAQIKAQQNRLSARVYLA